MGIRNNRYDADRPTVTGKLIGGRSKFVHERAARIARAATKSQAQVHAAWTDDPDRHPADGFYGDRVKMAFAFAELPEPGGQAIFARSSASTSSSSTSRRSTSI